jgi:hypothetical protein
VAASILVAFHAPWYSWAPLFAAAFILATRR